MSYNGKTCIFVKFGTYPAALIWTISPSLTLRFFRIVLFILIFPYSSLLSVRATTNVYFLFFPLIKIASPLKIFNSAIFACESWTDEFSSLLASSTWVINELLKAYSEFSWYLELRLTRLFWATSFKYFKI